MVPESARCCRELRQGRPVTVRSQGISMAPLLRQGDLVTVVPGNGWRLGDIVLYPRGEDLILHRVVGRTPQGVITKGDAVGHRDPPVASGEILGRAVFSDRSGWKLPLDTRVMRYLGLTFSLMVAGLAKVVRRLAPPRPEGGGEPQTCGSKKL